MKEDYLKRINDASRRQKEFSKKLDKLTLQNTLKILPALHEKAFEETDCLKCANCCKNHSPTFKTTDIKRISKTLGLKESVFIETYLSLDSDNDYVLQRHPCPFLNEDNTCFIYEERPGDCARYPYTNSDIFLKKKSLSLRNSMVCPAVVHVMDALTRMAML